MLVEMDLPDGRRLRIPTALTTRHDNPMVDARDRGRSHVIDAQRIFAERIPDVRLRSLVDIRPIRIVVYESDAHPRSKRKPSGLPEGSRMYLEAGDPLARGTPVPASAVIGFGRRVLVVQSVEELSSCPF
jgi:hypothetical protein